MGERSKTAVITGGTGQLGSVVTLAMIKDGWHVVVPCRDMDAGSQLQSGLPKGMEQSCTLVEADLTVERDVERLAERASCRSGRIDALVNLVGMFSFGTKIHELPAEKWHQVMDVNLTGVFLACKHVLPAMLKSGRGCIVNTASKAAVDIQPGAGVYAVAKAGVITLTQVLREELKDTSITVNAIMPGIIDTPVTRELMPKGDPSRWVKREQIAETVVSLCNGRVAGVSGSVLCMFGRL